MTLQWTFCSILVVIDVTVFAVLTLIDRPLPSWTYPFIFYVQVWSEILRFRCCWKLVFVVSQIAPIVGLYFPHSFNRIGKYVSNILCVRNCVVICSTAALFHWECLRFLLRLWFLCVWHHEFWGGLSLEVSTSPPGHPNLHYNTCL